MKKFGVMAIALGALAACSNNDTVNVLGQDCKKIATGERGDFVVKCPATEDLTSLRAVDKNAMFLSAVVNLEEIAADAESVYVNIVPAGTLNETDGTCYRILGNDPVFDGEQMYAVEICESVK